MSDKYVDVDDTVLTICSDYPEIKEIMASVGFSQIVKPGRIQTMGRLMTLRKGCLVKGIPLEIVVAALEDHGFTVTGDQQ